jgi:hypothetical protein
MLEKQQAGLREELDHYGTMTRNLLDTIKEAFRPKPDEIPPARKEE